MLDAIIVSDAGDDTYSASSPLRLKIDGRIASIQHVINYLANNGKIRPPVKGETDKNWHNAPKLNGIKIYDYLQQQGYTVALIDSYYHERNDFIKLLENNPKTIIISTTFILNKDALFDLVADIRSVASDIFIVAGGPFVFSSYLLLQNSGIPGYDVASARNDYLFISNDKHPDVDLYIIDKRGEQILPEVLERIKTGQKLNHLPNTAQWNGNKYVFSTRTQLAPPDMGIDWNNVPDRIFKSGAINIQASTGCRFNCLFCNFVKDKKYTCCKPLDQLIKELKCVSGKGIKYVRFVDDNFRLGQNDLNAVCKRFINEGLDLNWMSFIRASTLNQTDPELLVKSGCVEVQMGIESADKNVLKNMNKKADPEMYSHVILKLLDAGINCSCCFIVGFPGETERSINKTIDFINNISNNTQAGIFSWSMYPFLLVPLSPIYAPENRSRYNLEGYMTNWKHCTMNSDQAHRQITESFLKIDHASPIYSSDNMEMLLKLSLLKRKKFMKVRHELSKRFLVETLDKKQVLSSFSNIFE